MHRLRSLSPAARIGLSAICLALLTAIFSPLLAALPLLMFIMVCVAAPLMPACSLFLPVVSRGLPEKCAVALTFDDGPNPASTPQLLKLLAKYDARATFYVNGCRAEQYPDLIRSMLSLGHTIGNHSYSHDNFIMLKGGAALNAEIVKTQRVLNRLGVVPRTFRPPVGVTNPKLGDILDRLGMYAVNFNRRAGDRGNRQVSKLSQKILKSLRSGDIIMLHDIWPRDEEKARHWLVEVERILSGIQEKHLKILPLATLIDRPVMGFSVHHPVDRNVMHE
ncbi:polysaccharide deacetylase family protein [Desulfosarcina sp.]|uniref:polysaccharide deacetylase family protein n=1 Tax=Desulfosarcina sp. TaxID=2027861 RepID=UPI003970D15F